MLLDCWLSRLVVWLNLVLRKASEVFNSWLAPCLKYRTKSNGGKMLNVPLGTLKWIWIRSFLLNFATSHPLMDPCWMDWGWALWHLGEGGLRETPGSKDGSIRVHFYASKRIHGWIMLQATCGRVGIGHSWALFRNQKCTRVLCQNGDQLLTGWAKSTDCAAGLQLQPSSKPMQILQ